MVGTVCGSEIGKEANEVETLKIGFKKIIQCPLA